MTTNDFVYSCFLAILVYIGYMDFKTKEIQNKDLIPLLITGLLLRHRSLTEGLTAFLIIGILFLIISIMFKSFGGGDVKLIACAVFNSTLIIGFYTVFLAVALCAVFSLIYKSKNHSDTIPFAPFIGAAFILLRLLLIY